MDGTFATYARLIPTLQEYFERRYPRAPSDSEGVHRAAIRAKALDTLRGLLPSATQSNVGLFGTGQAFEALLLRMRAHPLAEARACADEMLVELRKVIPAFLTRVDQPGRGGVWSRYLASTRESLERIAQQLDVPEDAPGGAEVRLTDFDPEGEVKVVAAALYGVSTHSDERLQEVARRMTPQERAEVLGACVGERENRRHRPGRAFERPLPFDILTDYGASATFSAIGC